MSAANMQTITLEGDLTLPRAGEIRDLFLKGLREAAVVTLDFAGVGEIDLSFLQLLCSLHRSATREKKQVVIKGDAPKALRDAADAAGYLRQTGCKLDCDKTCLWVVITGGA